MSRFQTIPLLKNILLIHGSRGDVPLKRSGETFAFYVMSPRKCPIGGLGQLAAKRTCFSKTGVPRTVRARLSSKHNVLKKPPVYCSVFVFLFQPPPSRFRRISGEKTTTKLPHVYLYARNTNIYWAIRQTWFPYIFSQPVRNTISVDFSRLSCPHTPPTLVPILYIPLYIHLTTVPVYCLNILLFGV